VKPGLTLAFLVLFAPMVLGQRMSVDFDPVASKINWNLAGNVHSTRGTFQLKYGHVEAADGHISGELIVEADSGDSGNGTRDRRMKNEILETAKYPLILFKLTKLEGVEPDLRVTGELTIHGVSHELSVPMHLKINGDEVSAGGKFVVPYVEWGMKDPSNFLFRVNKTVEIELVAQGHVKR
jgi:polyisoprenoid-binding protein YceI